MKLKFLFLIILFCLSSFSILSQESKIKVLENVNEKWIEKHQSAYKKWVEKDAAYIITDSEKEAYLALKTDEEREKFIENFWRRRDPDPDTEINEFREEYYERIAYTNEHFTSGIQGWRTDRGLVFILFGKPDKIEKGRAEFENLKNILFETWSYQSVNETGSAHKYTFIDPTESGEFRLPKGERDKILTQSKSGLTVCSMCPQI